MKLRTKLTVAFGSMAAITLVVALIGFVEVRRLGGALYEVGTVRLPSIEGLEKMNEAKTALASSLRLVMAAAEQPGVLAAERERQRQAWERAQAGWTLYEPLPQTPEESVVWKKFVTAWERWKADHARMMTLAAPAVAEDGRGSERRWPVADVATHVGLLRTVEELLDDLLEINRQIAAAAKAESIATREDMEDVQRFMILAALAGLLGAVALGVALGRRLSGPMTEAARVLSRIAHGDFSARMNFSSRDEIGEMATAMNTMAVTLHNSEARFAEIFNHTTDALFFVRVTVDGRFVYEDFNPTALRLTGIKEGTVRERVAADILPPAVAAQVEENYQRCVAAGGPIGYEEEFVLPVGPRVFNTLLIPIKDASGRVARIAGFARDVTDRHQAERTRHLLEAQLRQAQKLEAVGQLAGGVAHDFNNILAAIMLHLDILRTQAELPRSMREDLEQLGDEAKRGAKLTRQLLLFSRKAVMRREVVNLSSLFTELLKMLRRLIGEHVTIELVAPTATSPLTYADPGMLEQVVMNLVVNARDAMSGGGRIVLAIDHVEVDQARLQNDQATPGPYVRLAVRDSGCGMSEEVMGKIFEPFFTTKGPEKGTGLGLAMVFGIAQEHGGWVEVESQVGKGSTFAVLLPEHRGPVGQGSATDSDEVARGGSESILVAEDDRSLRVATALILRNHGYRVFEAPDEGTAKTILRNAELPIDLVLADVALPGGIFGHQLEEELMGRSPRPKVMLMSGFNAELPHGRIPVDCYLPKPFNAGRLLRAVRGCLEGRSTEGLPRRANQR